MSQEETLGKPAYFSKRKIFMRSLKPSDYFLYKSIRDHFVLDEKDPRGVLVLGCRLIYALAQDSRYRDMLLPLATQINSESLDYETEAPHYKPFSSFF